MSMQQPEPIQIVCTIDDAYVPHCGVMLTSLFLNNPNTSFRVFILHGFLSDASREQLRDFIQDKGHDAEFYKVNESLFRHAPVSNHVSLATYYRIAIPLLIPPSVQKVLFLDSDLIVRADISDLWNTCLRDNYVGACPDYVTDDFKIRLGLQPGSGYFNAGVLLINLVKWREARAADRLIDFISQHQSRITFWDQDALNATFEKNWKKLDLKWNVGNAFYTGTSLHDYFHLTPERFRQVGENPSILHYAGSDKPWNVSNRHPLRGEYLHYKAISPWRHERLEGQVALFQRLTNKCRRLLNSFGKLMKLTPS